MKKIGVIGGGINGLLVAKKLQDLGCQVDLYEKGRCLSQTSSASSKLLHGGIRYLEQGHVHLVRESLRDRAWWLTNAPEFCWPIKIIMPVYKTSPRGVFKLFCGAQLYRFLAGRYSLGPTGFIGKQRTKELFCYINHEGLSGAVSFFDAQMNEDKLGSWVLAETKNSGCTIFEQTQVEKFTDSGEIHSARLGCQRYDLIINASGPWAAKLNQENSIETNHTLRLIRGSHILINRTCSHPFLFQEHSGNRVVFILPYLGKTLVGTTEVPQSIHEKIECSVQERNYLIDIFNNNFVDPITASDITEEFSGLRPIVSALSNGKSSHFSSASRECQIELYKKVLSIYGGKWTSAPSLSDKVVSKLIRSARIA
ncbi:FAD-dependent oxidoreductase [Gammaproteobacteria bacterium]|nr:FAD-dependent oxidoreductase [Gammaproteobacteria bacterium]